MTAEKNLILLCDNCSSVAVERTKSSRLCAACMIAKIKKDNVKSRFGLKDICRKATTAREATTHIEAMPATWKLSHI